MLIVSNSSLETYQKVIKEKEIKELKGKGKFMQKSLALLEILNIPYEIEIIEKDEIIIKLIY
jgi:hypothetical protein